MAFHCRELSLAQELKNRGLAVALEPADLIVKTTKYIRMELTDPVWRRRKSDEFLQVLSDLANPGP